MSPQFISRPRADSSISVLVALADPIERAALRSILSRTNWQVHTLSGTHLAAGFLRAAQFGVVVVSYRSSGIFTWQDLLEETRRLAPQPRLVVTDRMADEPSWAEVLSLGAYDLLAQPFDPQEVFHVLTSAWRSWYEEMVQSRCQRSLAG